jgi:hypothetical protein
MKILRKVSLFFGIISFLLFLYFLIIFFCIFNVESVSRIYKIFNSFYLIPQILLATPLIFILGFILNLVLIFKNKKEKLAIIGIVLSLISIIGVLFMIWAFNQIDSKCRVADNGWSCNYIIGLEIKRDANKCAEQGGKWECYGWCMPDYTHYCDFPNSDVGKECLNSDECKGKCTIKEEDIEKSCSNYLSYRQWRSLENQTVQWDDQFPLKCEGVKGECSQYILRTCDGWYELNNGEITRQWAICD